MNKKYNKSAQKGIIKHKYCGSDNERKIFKI